MRRNIKDEDEVLGKDADSIRWVAVEGAIAMAHCYK